MNEPVYKEGELAAPELVVLEEEFEAADRRARELTEGLDPEQLAWRPPSGGWSVVECLDHLNSVGFRMLPRFDREIADGWSSGLQRGGPPGTGLIARFAIRSMEPPVRRFRMSAPSMYRPRSPEDPKRVVRELIELQGELIKRLREADGLALEKLRITSPFSRLVRFHLADWLRFLAAHQRRHLWQAEQVTSHPEFPS